MLLPVLLLLAAADGDPPPARSVLVLDLAATDVPAGAPRLLSCLLAESVARAGLKTLAQEEMRRVVALEGEKAAMGCETSSCLAEMASAMGVDYVVFGDVGKLGNAFIVTLRLYDSKKNDTISRETLQAADVDGLRSGLDATVAALMSPVATRAVAAPASESSGLFVPGVVVAASGGALAVGAGIVALVFDDTLGKAGAPSNDKELALGVGPWAIAGASLGVVVAVVGGGLIGMSMVEGS